MTTDLRTTLDELAGDVRPAPDLAAVTWAAGRRRRRRRRSTGAAVVVAACLAATGAVVDGGPPGARRSAPAAPAATGAPDTSAPDVQQVVVAPGTRLQHLPLPDEVGRLPLRASRLPRLDLDPAAALPLSASPPGIALAVVQRAPEGGTPGDVFVLGEDGHTRRLDRGGPYTVRDGDGSPRPSLDAAALDTAGRRLALPRDGAVDVVDLTRGTLRSYPVPGVLPSVRWSGDGDRLLVEDGSRLATDQRDRRLVLDLRTGRVDDAPAALRDPVRNAVAASGDGWLRIDPRSTVEVGADGEVASRKETQLWIAGFWGPAVARGTLLAQAAFGPGGENLVVVADTATGSVPVVLHAPMRVEGGWSKICCGPVTWLDDTTLLLDAQGHLLTWDVLSGALAWVADLPDLVVAVHRLG